jgi:hypothetical protein
MTKPTASTPAKKTPAAKAPAGSAKKAPARKQPAGKLAPVEATRPRKPRGPLPPSQNAIRLFRWLETEWDRMGVLPTIWCRQNGIPDPTVLRWQHGTEPDFRSLQRVAAALGRSIIDLLLVGGYISEEEANGHLPQPIVLDAEVAIRKDPRISDVLAEAMLRLWENYEEIEAGIAKRIESKTGGVRGTRSRTSRS